MSYYYLAASLPALRLDSPPPFSSEEFRALCGEHLTGSDLLVLDEALGATQTPRRRFARTWHQRDAALRNAIVRIRASRLHVDAGEHLKGDALDTECERAAAEAYARPNASERELELDRFRWAQLDELAGLDPFTISALVAYGLKLRIAERWAALDIEAGAATVETLIAKTEQSEENETGADSRTGE